jgi:3-oxoacyl-[acyl-carrier-protein] synthase II
MGEGAGVLFLEEYEHAVERGARIYAEVAGINVCHDGTIFTELKDRNDGLSRAMKLALQEAQLDTVDTISTSGCSVGDEDQEELTAINRVFDKIPELIAFKSHIGHTGQASMSVESVLSLKAMHENQLPAIRNLKEPIKIHGQPQAFNFVTANKAK